MPKAEAHQFTPPQSYFNFGTKVDSQNDKNEGGADKGGDLGGFI